MTPQKVEMQCIQDRGELCVVVRTPGPYQGCKVRCSRKKRVLGAWYIGTVYSTHKIDADKPHCNLVGDYDAFERIEKSGI